MMLRPSAAVRRKPAPVSTAVTPVVADCALIAVAAFVRLVAALVVPAMLIVKPFSVIVSVPATVMPLVVVPVATFASAVACKPLTPDALAALYKSIVAKYYGASCVIDDSIENEWMRIGHFYNAFYVYQYATGLSAACALVNGMLKEGKPAVDRYLAFLSAGKSKDSIDLLKDAGVDMTSTAPVQAAFDMFAEYLDLFEKELAAHA